MIFNIYIFNRQGKCLFYREWSRPHNPMADEPGEDQKLMFGLIFSLQQFVRKISPIDNAEGLRSYRSAHYTLHHYEAPSGVKFIVNTDPVTKDMRTQLQHIYANLFVEYVVKNPLYVPNEAIDMTTFEAELEKYIRGLHFFR